MSNKIGELMLSLENHQEQFVGSGFSGGGVVGKRKIMEGEKLQEVITVFNAL